MGLIQLILVLIVIGVALWAVNTYVPMAQPLKTILNVLVVVCVVLALLNAFGVLGFIDIPIRRYR
jgi:hypothetical protein